MDDYLQWSTVEAMSRKAETLRCYKDYESWLDMQHKARIKWFQSDRGGEFLSHEFDMHLKARGTIRSLTVHDMPKENGVSEHLNCTLLKHARAMLLAAGLPKFLWFEAIWHATWLNNCTSTCALNRKTLFEMQYKEKPNLENLLEWGTQVFVLREGRRKLDEKADEGRWVGYSPDS